MFTVTILQNIHVHCVGTVHSFSVKAGGTYSNHRDLDVPALDGDERSCSKY